MRLLADFANNIHGNAQGKKLYGVIFIDTDDSEDTSLELWRADDFGELEALLRKNRVGEDTSDPYYKQRSEKFDEDYDFTILTKLIGSIIA